MGGTIQGNMGRKGEILVTVIMGEKGKGRFKMKGDL